MFTLQSQFFFPNTTTPVANGSVVLALNPPTGITILSTGGAAPVTYTFNLDSNGNLNGGQVWGQGELTPPGSTYTANIFSGANGTGSLVSGPFTWIIGPATPYAGTLYPNVTALPLLFVNATSVDGVGVTGTPVSGQVIIATSGTAAIWNWPLPATQTAPAHEFATAIDHSGNVTWTQPAFTDISGTVAAGQLPNPTTSTLGGIEAINAVTHKWINAISNSGVPSLSQPAAADLSDGTTGTGGAVVLATSPTITTPTVSGNLSLTGKLAEYNGINTAGNGTSVVYAAVDSTNLSANVSATTIYAVPSAGTGFYRIDGTVIVTTVATTSSTMPGVTMTWTDGDNNTAQSFTFIVSNSGNTLTTFAQATMRFWVKGGTNLQYATTGYASSGATAMKYALHLRLEAL